MKKYVDISGFNINYANRGNSALSYGAINFLVRKGFLKHGQELVKYTTFRNFFKMSRLFPRKETVTIFGEDWVINYIPVFFIERYALVKFGIIFPFTYFGKYIRNTAYEAADYGGDGFSDIYGDQLFLSRLNQTAMLKKANIPLIMLPMTIGPFHKKQNYNLAVRILKYASKIYIRDDKYISELKKMGVKYERENDLSSYMLPEKWDIKIQKPSVGINVSGLAYSNLFPNLEGQFDNYPALIDSLICHFKGKGLNVYLIPHSYNYSIPEENNDDMVACRMAYKRLKDRSQVTLLDMNLTSPKVKYVISQMCFFIGTRMHANFAAIFTGVPVFGLAYSYKFAGAFESNGLDPEKQTYMINYLKLDDIEDVVKKIDDFFEKSRRG